MEGSSKCSEYSIPQRDKKSPPRSSDLVRRAVLNLQSVSLFENPTKVLFKSQQLNVRFHRMKKKMVEALSVSIH